MKMQKFVTFTKKNFWKIKNIVKLEIIAITEKYRGTAHSIWNLKLVFIMDLTMVIILS